MVEDGEVGLRKLIGIERDDRGWRGKPEVEFNIVVNGM